MTGRQNIVHVCYHIRTEICISGPLGHLRLSLSLSFGTVACIENCRGRATALEQERQHRGSTVINSVGGSDCIVVSSFLLPTDSKIQMQNLDLAPPGPLSTNG